ncbi:CoA-binding protein [Xylanibacillus composti]|uniref:CoA-binding protein n=1 Tax=Xylanibacillus composti TaxID=1572762 RepID=A0A8J4H2L0_9BACL|nr:CoA-binding protein [Xylanibacillus composti]MDT9724179.1 CoA-binding protein [Xylanibacillus composti]GIQ68306.1 CoA-binding protein [Xylanibacillus composti]
MPYEHPAREDIRKLLEQSHTIAVVGCSDNPERTSYQIAEAMQAKGYRIIPVNPNADNILGEICYPTLMDVPEKIDIVNVFRRSETVVPIAEEAVRIGAKAFWLQLGILNEEAGRIAEEGGLTVIMDRCIKVEDAILLPDRKQTGK